MRELLSRGLHLFAKWDYVFISPPLTITDDELSDAMHLIDEALALTDALAAERQAATR